jgi:hypothetical protein
MATRDYGCGICGNHVHLVIRTHRHKAREQWSNIAESTRKRLRHRLPERVSSGHPVVSARPCTVLLFTPDEVRGRIEYVGENPLKEGLSRQCWGFVVAYDDWPLHRGGERSRRSG